MIRFTKIGEIRDQIITVAVLIFAAVLMVARQDDAFQNVRKASLTLVSLAETPLSNVRVYRSALRTNAELEQNTILLHDELSRLRSAADENRVLRELLNLNREYEYDMQPVRIITKSLTGVNNTMIVNAGEAHGVKTGMPVVNHQGLAGTITITARNYAKVLPLLNNQFRSSVMIEGSRAYGILSWESSGLHEMTVRFVPQTINVEPGMRVYTSGFSNQLPPNIPVGVVTRTQAEPGRETQLIYIRPHVDFSTLAEAHVLLYEADPEVIELEETWLEAFQ